VLKIRLRTKFLLSLVAISSGLMTATLVTVRYSVQRQVRASLSDDLRNSVSTYQSFEQQSDATLTRSAELVANLPNLRALMTTHDIPTIQDGSDGIWKLSGADFIVLVDPAFKAMALRAESKDLTESNAEQLLRNSVGKERQRDWWYGAHNLYEVWIQPIYFGPQSDNNILGFVAIGEEIDDAAVHSVANVAASDAVFSFGGTPVQSTLGASQLAAFRKFPAAQLAGSSTVDAPKEIQLGDERYLLTSVNLSTTNDSQVTLNFLKSFDKAAAFLGALNKVLIALGLFTILAGSALVYFISDTFTRPLASLVGGVRALERGDYTYPLSGDSGDEVAEVTTAFATMRSTLKQSQDEQKALAERLRQAHKMEAVGRLAGGVAHDFNNLLTVIRGHSDLLLEQKSRDEAEKHSIEQIQRAADRAVAMTRQLLAFSRMQVLQPRVLDLNAVVVDMGKMLPRLIGSDIEYSFAAEKKIALVKADPGQLEQVIMNLAVNARDAMPDGGKLIVKTSEVVIDDLTASKHSPMTSGHFVLLSVSDTGQGMSAETQTHIFEPFFTTKELGKGTGLGLATVYGVVKQSNGFIWVESALNEGSRFEIYLPVANEPVAVVVSEPAPQAVPRGRETILVVEDEEGVRELACQFLRVKGYTVLEACDGTDALAVVKKHSGEIHLLLSDMVMPKLGGIDLADRLKALNPTIKIVLMSGYYEYSNANSSRIPVGTTLLQKPFSPTSLVGKVREALTAAPAAQPENSAVRSLVS
jgi:signal transduction histidine kinase/ActR/RegA family two-component response regulator